MDEPGNVLAENSAAMSFQEGGQIAHVYVSEGSQVSAGTVLADLDSAQLNAAVTAGECRRSRRRRPSSHCSQSGTRPEQLTIDQSAVTSADQSLGIAVGNAYSASDDAVTNQLDNMFCESADRAIPTFLVPNTISGTVNNITESNACRSARRLRSGMPH